MNSPDTNRNLKNYPLVAGIIITVVFSVILSINEIFQLFSALLTSGLSRELSSLLDFSARFVSGAFAILIVIPAILYLSLKRVYLKENYHDLKHSMVSAPVRAVVVGTISSICYFLICIIIGSALGTLRIDFSIILDIDTGIGWIVFLYALVPAIWEELAFRGAIMNTVRKKYSATVAILVSSVLFGLFHTIVFALRGDYSMVIFGFIMSTLFGLTWGYTNIKCDSLLPGVVAHYMIDAFGYAFIYHSMNAVESLVGQFFIATTVLYPLVTIILVKIICTHFMQVENE